MNRFTPGVLVIFSVALTTIASLIFGFALQFAFCFRMGNDVELHNRLLFSSLVFPAFFLLLRYGLCRLLTARYEIPSATILMGTVWASAPVILLSPGMAFLPNHVLSIVSMIAVLSAAAFLGHLFFAGHLEAFRGSVGGDIFRGLKRHGIFVGILLVAVGVLTAEIGEDFAVFESDGPYYGHFAQNILRYDVNYTYFLRTHGSGDIQQPVDDHTFNMRHPTGFTTLIVMLFLFVGSDLSPAAFRIFPLVINLLTLILIYRFVRKKTASEQFAAFSVFVYLFVPIAISFNTKVHLMGLINFALFLLVYMYDQVLSNPDDQKIRRYFYILCFLTLHIDWYLMFLYPLIWGHYLFFSSRKHRDIRFVIALPVVCILSALIMLIQMYMAAENFEALQKIYALRFENYKVNSATTYKFLFDMSDYLISHFTLIIAVLGLLWPIHFIYRLRKGDRQSMDWISILFLTYGIVNMVILKKTRTHYFEVIHFLPYVVFAVPFLLVRLAGAVSQRVIIRNALIGMTLMFVLPQTIDGVLLYRLNTYRPFVPGFSDAMTYVDERLGNVDTVLINRKYHRYNNERYLTRKRKIFCNSLSCFKKEISKDSGPRFAILFKKRPNHVLFDTLYRKGAVKYFRDEIAVIDLKQKSNVSFVDRQLALKSFSQPKVHDKAMGEGIQLVVSSLNTKVIQQKTKQTAINKYFHSWDGDIKQPIEYRNVMEVSYLYNKLEAQGSDVTFTTILEKVGDPQLTTSFDNFQTNSWFKVENWKAGEFVKETLSFDLGDTVATGFYNVYLQGDGPRIYIDTLKVIPRELPRAVEELASRYFVPLKINLYPGLEMIGYHINPKAVSPGRKVAVTLYLQKTAAFKGEKRLAMGAICGDMTFEFKSLNVASPIFWKKDRVYAATAYFSIPDYVGSNLLQFLLKAADRTIGFRKFKMPAMDTEYSLIDAKSGDRNPIRSTTIAGGEIHHLKISQKDKASENKRRPERFDTVTFRLSEPSDLILYVETFPEAEERGFVVQVRDSKRQTMEEGVYLSSHWSHKIEKTIIPISRKKLKRGVNTISLRKIPAPTYPKVLYGWRSYVVPFAQPFINRFWGGKKRLGFPAIRNVTLAAVRPKSPGFFDEFLKKLTEQAEPAEQSDSTEQK